MSEKEVLHMGLYGALKRILKNVKYLNNSKIGLISGDLGSVTAIKMDMRKVADLSSKCRRQRAT